MTATMFQRAMDRTDADNRYTKEQIGKTYPGMAHFGGTSEIPATCGRCDYFNRTSKAKSVGYCTKYLQIATRPVKSLRFPSTASACRYFEREKGGK